MLYLRSILLSQHNLAAFYRKADAIAFARANRWTTKDVIKARNALSIFYVVGQCFPGETWIYHMASKDGSVAKFSIPEVNE